MIDVKNLRIGNYVDLFGYKIISSIQRGISGTYKIEVYGKGKSGKLFIHEWCNVESLELKLIPLNHDLLEKIGFKNTTHTQLYEFKTKNGNQIYLRPWMDGGYVFGIINRLFDDEEDFSDKRAELYGCKVINNLNELQNLVFSMTDEELELDLDISYFNGKYKIDEDGE